MATATQRPWKSGWCSTGIHDWQHAKCRGAYDRNDQHHDCACACHVEAPATDVWTVYWVDRESSEAQAESGWKVREDADRFAQYLLVHKIADVDAILVEPGAMSL